MEGERGHSKRQCRVLRHWAAGAVCLMALSQLVAGTGCSGGDTRSFVPNVDSTNRTPTMTTTNVDTYISDSGYTRYHVVAPIWLMYDEGADPYWHFPEGMHLEQYDLQMRPQADVACDTARYFTRRRVWQLDGNVVMLNTLRDSFLTQQLYWNQQHRRFYTDSFVHIVRTDHTIEGYGMEANENLTAYTIHRTTAILPSQRTPKPQPAAVDSAEAAAKAQADSARHKPPRQVKPAGRIPHRS